MTSLRRRLARRAEREQERLEDDAERKIRKAQFAPFGSIARRDNPLDYGTVFRRNNPALANAYDEVEDRAKRLERERGLRSGSLRRLALSRSPFR